MPGPLRTLTAALAVSFDTSEVGDGTSVGGSGVAVGASDVAVAGTAVGAAVIVGLAGVWVKVGRNVLVGTGVVTGPRAARGVVQLDRATASNTTPITAQIL